MREFELCQFIYAPLVKGFDPQETFVAHFHLVGYSNLIGIFSPQEGEGVLRILEMVFNINFQSKKLYLKMLKRN